MFIRITSRPPSRMRKWNRFRSASLVEHIYQSKKLHIMNQGSNFLRSTFNDRDNVRESQPNLEEKVDPRILKYDFFLKKRPLHFPTKSTSIIRLAKQNRE